MQCLSHAKINLYLDVLNKRQDGYHNIETIFQTVALADSLAFEPRPRGVTMACSIPDLPCDSTNLVMRAAAALQQATGTDFGVHIHLDKRIPAAAGLAGGSGNAAATLFALNRLWNLELSMPQLERIAATLGADVPYCLRGGTAAATGKGEKLSSLPDIPQTWCVLLHPPLALSTAAMYSSPHLAKNTAARFAGRTREFRNAIRAVRANQISKAVSNRMETAAFHLHPELEGAKTWLLERGCTAAAMSGSGPTLFGLCANAELASKIAAAWNAYPATVTHTVNAGLSLDRNSTE